MTEKYTAAKNLAARGGQITIQGNAKLGIPGQLVEGSTVVGRMETIETVADPRSLKGNPRADAGVASNPAKPGLPLDGPITFYADGSRSLDIARLFGHEILHTIYSGIGITNGGWTNADFNLEHQDPFDNASDAIQ